MKNTGLTFLFIISSFFIYAQNCGSQLAIGAQSSMTSEIEVFLGSNLTLSAPSTSSTNTYQWYKRDINNSLQAITGATSFNHTISNISNAELGRYNCSVDGQFDATDLVVRAFNNSYADRMADSLALVDFYTNTDGLNWTNNTNWLNGPIDTWHGVTVNNCRVTELDLYNNNLNGTIPPSFQTLSQLRHLHIGHNATLTGDLSIQGLSKLEFLGAHYCSFTSFTVNSSNRFYGSLEILDLSNNAFNGSSLDISAMPYLKKLDAQKAGFGGQLLVNNTYEFYTRLERINIWDNQFSGALDITNMPRIQHITAHYNNLTDFVKSNATNYYTKLKYILLTSNNFSNSVFDVSNMPILENLTAEHAQINTVIWNTASNYYQNLKQINFSSNNLSGEFDIRGLPSLEDLRISSNNLEKIKTGSLIHSNLKVLIVHQNDFQGNHLNVKNMPNLEILSASYSNIDKVHFSTGTNFYQELHTITLDANNLSGVYSFENTPKLTTLELTQNDIDQISFNNASGYYSNAGNIIGRFSQNSLDFFSFEGHMSLFAMTSSTFSPQEKVGLSYLNNSGIRTLTVDNVGTTSNLSYVWYKDGSPISPPNNSDVLTLTTGNYGIYHCEVSNSAVTPLTLESINFDYNSLTPVAPQNNGSMTQQGSNNTVFPNPIKNGQTLTLKPSFNISQQGSYHVTISRVNDPAKSKTYTKSQVSKNHSTNELSFVLAKLSAGYHIVKVSDGKGKNFSTKILVSN